MSLMGARCASSHTLQKVSGRWHGVTDSGCGAQRRVRGRRRTSRTTRSHTCEHIGAGTGGASMRAHGPLQSQVHWPKSICAWRGPSVARGLPV